MLDALIQDFLHHLQYVRRHAAHTLEAYSRDLRQFEAYLSKTYELKDPKDIRHYHIRSWLAEAQSARPMAATTRNRKLSSLSAFFKFLLTRGHITQNPAKLLPSLRKPEQVPSFLKPEETAHLLEETSFGEGWDGLNHRTICELLYGAGLRRAELIGLSEKDVEADGRLRVLGKGNKERLLPIGPQLRQCIEDYRAAKRHAGIPLTGPLLVLEDGRPLYPSYVYRAVRRHLSQVSTLKKQSPHVLRHTFATHLLNNGANIQTIKELLGHSSLAATQLYTHTNIDFLKEIHHRLHPRS